jgi:hypothetical protein
MPHGASLRVVRMGKMPVQYRYIVSFFPLCNTVHARGRGLCSISPLEGHLTLTHVFPFNRNAPSSLARSLRWLHSLMLSNVPAHPNVNPAAMGSFFCFRKPNARHYKAARLSTQGRTVDSSIVVIGALPVLLLTPPATLVPLATALTATETNIGQLPLNLHLFPLPLVAHLALLPSDDV